ncbi:hypothetical protein CU098_011942 [Rhizopus stolonifer]|uniref:AB hydrolase-1 domain-containing protein n=1 Tax=Rhizopus stolonifer TaxID=4846 RepID=A0A367KP53_RHIST|nr:hypothetical protein CU098_011942 [Rhizopus stolonifer]
MTSHSIRPLIGSKSTPVSTQSKLDRSSLSHTGRNKSSDNVHPQPLSLPDPPGMPRLNVLRESRLHQTFQYEAPLGGQLKSHKVGYAEYGPSQGHPVFVIGGYGCTRLVGIMFEEISYRYGLRTIWPERPGYGLSDECNSQQMTALEWADVVIQLSSHIGISQFGIIAQSVGTVFALAVAHRFKARIVAPIYLISPWVSAHAANTFKWTRRLPTALVAKTISLALDVMWIFSSKSSKSEEENKEEPAKASVNRPQRHTMVAFEEDVLLASLDDEPLDLPTDFPTHRPLRHFVRPQHMSLYLAMNQKRMSEPYNQGQLCDIMVALEKHHLFGFNYSDVKVSVSAVWGDQDSLIPLKAIETLANSLRDVRLKILESEGHDLVWKEGVMEWAMRGIAERWKHKEESL